MIDLRTTLQTPHTPHQIADGAAQHSAAELDALLAAAPALLSDRDTAVADNTCNILLAHSARVATALQQIDITIFYALPKAEPAVVSARLAAFAADFAAHNGQPPPTDWHVAGLVTALVATLYVHPNANLRMKAAVILGAMQDVRVYPYLLAAAQDSDADVAHMALHGLDAHLLQPEHIDVLLPMLDDPNADDRLFDLLTLTPSVTLAPLLDCLAHAHTTARRAAVAGMLTSFDRRDMRIFDALMLALNDADEVRAQAINSLGWLGNRWAAASVFSILQSTTNAQVRNMAVQALGNIGDSSHVPALLDVLRTARQTSDRAWQTIIIQTLGRLGDTRAVPLLLEGLADVPVATAAALGLLGDERAVEPLLLLLTREAQEMMQNAQPPFHFQTRAVFFACADALGLIGDARAAAPLQLCLQQSAQIVKNMANHTLKYHQAFNAFSYFVRALGDLAQPNMTAEVIETMAWPLSWDVGSTPRSKMIAAVALVQCGDARGRAVLEHILSEKEAFQTAAAIGLAYLGDAQARALLQAYIADAERDPSLRGRQLVRVRKALARVQAQDGVV
jgi:HEAT repeat protein